MCLADLPDVPAPTKKKGKKKKKKKKGNTDLQEVSASQMPTNHAFAQALIPER